jgi:hypothetical protein
MTTASTIDMISYSGSLMVKMIGIQIRKADEKAKAFVNLLPILFAKNYSILYNKGEKKQLKKPRYLKLFRGKMQEAPPYFAIRN